MVYSLRQCLWMTLFLLVSGCINPGPVCNRPYIQVGYDCCLDEDDNRICDRDKPVTATTIKALATSTTRTTTTLQPVPASPSWQYRTGYTIHNQGESLEDFQVLLDVDTRNLVTEGKMLADCADIRFTDSEGKEMPYYIQPGTNNTPHTYVTVKVPHIPANGSTTVFMYYGNDKAPPASNGKETYIAYFGFDDYVNGILTGQDGWGGTTGQEAMDVQSRIKLGGEGKAIELNDPKRGDMYHTHELPATRQIVYTTFMRRDSIEAQTTTYVKSTYKDMTAIEYIEGGYLNIWTDRRGLKAAALDDDRWYRIDVALDCDREVIPWVKVDHNKMASDLPLADDQSCDYIDNIRLAWGTSPSDTWIDDISMSKYAEPMPTYSKGQEEKIH